MALAPQEMTLKYIAALFALMLACSANAQVTLWGIDKGAESHDSIIKNVCLHDTATGAAIYSSLSSEDSGLVIRLRSSDGTVLLTYDAAAEIEALAALDTWAAPSASNIRVLVQENGCYQLAPAANTFDVGDYMALTITDTSSPAFGHYEAIIPFIATSTDNQADVVAGIAGSSAITAIDDYIDTEVATLVEALVGLGAEFTADSGTTTTIVDAALTQATNDWFLGQGVLFTSSTLAGQTACISGFTAASDTLTITTVTATVGTQTYYILPMAKCQTGDSFARIGAAGAGLTAIDLPANSIGSSEIADGAIDAAATAADFSTEVQDADVESINNVTINGDGGADGFGL